MISNHVFETLFNIKNKYNTSECKQYKNLLVGFLTLSKNIIIFKQYYTYG